MCLSSITKTYPKKDKTEGYGWKVITINEEDKNTFIFPYFFGFFPNHYNKWIRRKITPIIGMFFSYDSGFHIFKTRKDARIYKHNFDDERVVKVQYKGIVCEGIQDTDYAQLRCLVVKQIKVLK